MAIITEEPVEFPKPQLRKSKANPKPKPDPTPVPSPSPPPKPGGDAGGGGYPFQFWLYATVAVSLTTISLVFLSYLSPQDPRTWFLNLSPILRDHYSAGRTIKVQTAPNLPQVEIFSVQKGPTVSDSHVLIVHGIGCSSFAFRDVVSSLGRRNVHVVAIDLPGSGFSDKSIVVSKEYHPGGTGSGGFGRLWEVYEEIKEKGLFWGFDQLIEQGYVDFEENNKIRASKERKRDVVEAIELGSEEAAKVLRQVVDSMGLAPVDLVLHDSALSMATSWIAGNRAFIRSLTILDGAFGTPAFPLWILETPLVREVVLASTFVFERVVYGCCMGSGGGGGGGGSRRAEADAHRVLLKGRNGRRSVVGMGKKLNLSFDVSEWGGLDEVKLLPIRVLWSDKWADEGHVVAHALPWATPDTHSGGRWTQGQNAEEVAEKIYEFISSLPKVVTPALEERLEPEHKHVEKLFGEGKSSDDRHRHGHHHAHAGYMNDAYGVGQGWPV